MQDTPQPPEHQPAQPPAPDMPPQQPSAPAGEAVRYAGIFPRFIAMLIDSVLLVVVFVILFFMLKGVLGIELADFSGGGMDNPEMAAQALGSAGMSMTMTTLLQLIVAIPYYVMLVSGKHQATLGKQAMNIYITTADGGKPDMQQVFIRYFVAWWWLSVLSLLLGALHPLVGVGSLALLIQVVISTALVLVTAQKTAVHDKLAKTRVVYGKPA